MSGILDLAKLRQMACNQTSTSSAFACPGLDGGQHSRVCDIATEAARKAWHDTDRLAELSPMPDIAAEIEKLPFTVVEGIVKWADPCLDASASRPTMEMWSLLQRLAIAQKGTP